MAGRVPGARVEAVCRFLGAVTGQPPNPHRIEETLPRLGRPQDQTAYARRIPSLPGRGSGGAERVIFQSIQWVAQTLRYG